MQRRRHMGQSNTRRPSPKLLLAPRNLRQARFRFQGTWMIWWRKLRKSHRSRQFLWVTRAQMSIKVSGLSMASQTDIEHHQMAMLPGSHSKLRSSLPDKRRRPSRCRSTPRTFMAPSLRLWHRSIPRNQCIRCRILATRGTIAIWIKSSTRRRKSYRRSLTRLFYHLPINTLNIAIGRLRKEAPWRIHPSRWSNRQRRTISRCITSDNSKHHNKTSKSKTHRARLAINLRNLGDLSSNCLKRRSMRLPTHLKNVINDRCERAVEMPLFITC